jgi:hypothetical protein
MSASPPVWLLDLTIGGRTERFATRPFVVSTAAGVELQYREGLSEIALDLSADLGDGELSTAVSVFSTALEGVSTTTGGWARLVLALHQLEGSGAVLRRWTPGTNIESARTMLSGFAESVEFGGVGEPLEFTLRRLLFAGDRPMLNPVARVDAETWPLIVAAGINSDDKIQGALYPLIIGYPGDDTGKPFPGLSQTPASPGLLAQWRAGLGLDDYLVISDGVIDAEEVRVFDYGEDPRTFDDRSVIQVEDLLGRTVSATQFATPSAINPIGGHAYYVGFSTANGKGGGVKRPRGAGVLRGLGEVIAYLLDRFTGVELQDVDERLNAWLIDTWINEGGVGAWEWIASELTPLAPFRLVQGRTGLAVRLMDWEAKPGDAVARFDVTLRQAERVSGIRFASASSIRNQVTVEFRPDRDSGSYLDTRTLGPSHSLTDPRILGSTLSATSVERLGGIDVGIREAVIQSSHITSPATAILAARYMLAERALPSGRVQLKAPIGLEDRIDPTDPIIVHDPEIGLVERVGLVERLTPRESDTLMTVAIIDDPTTFTRAEI